MDLPSDSHMHLPPSSSPRVRLWTIVAILMSASSVALALQPDRTRPLWQIALTPAVFICLATAAWLDERARTTPHLKRWALVCAGLGGACALGSLFVTVCARGACRAI